MWWKIIGTISTPKSTKLHVLVENENQKHENECKDLSKNHQNGHHFGTFGGHFGILLVFWGFLLQNVAPSYNLILNCKIPINSIKQGIFILPAKFKPYFYTCKWIWFSCILSHISPSLIKQQKIQHNQNISNLEHIWWKGHLLSSYLN